MAKKKEETQEIRYGWKPSEIDGTEYEFDFIPNFKIPEEYSYVDFLPPIENQGNTNMCVTYALAAHLNWNFTVDHAKNNTEPIHIDKKEIYSVRKIPGDNGMTFKEALSYVRKHGVKSDYGNVKIERYSMVKSIESLKQALLLNGPCIGGMYVKDHNKTEFWIGSKNNGGHAIAIVGYDKKGFIIRNSWGKNYGNRGYATLKYEDFPCLLECWTIVD